MLRIGSQLLRFSPVYSNTASTAPAAIPGYSTIFSKMTSSIQQTAGSSREYTVTKGAPGIIEKEKETPCNETDALPASKRPAESKSIKLQDYNWSSTKRPLSSHLDDDHYLGGFGDD